MDNTPTTIGSGPEQAVYHVPVMLKESIDGLNIQAGGVYVDVTFGGGGHSREILRRLEAAEEETLRRTAGHGGTKEGEPQGTKEGEPQGTKEGESQGTREEEGRRGRLFSFDQDADAERNIPANDRFTFVRSNFRYLKNWMRYYGIDGIDGLLADLGVSSHHFDDETRGFSFRYDAPLDMRMNKRDGITAADIVNTYDEERLADTLYFYGELKNSRRIAAAIVRARQAKRIQTTTDLLRAIKAPFFSPKGEGREPGSNAIDVSPHEKKDLARLFQALRIEVNHEMDALREMLQSAIELLKPGGRLSVITYHSLEDRIVKNFIKTGNAEGRRETDFYGKAQVPLQAVNGKVDTPSLEEQRDNPRSRSAKLRIAEKKANG